MNFIRKFKQTTMKQNKVNKALNKRHFKPPFVPRQYNVAHYIKFWEGGSIPESKGGSFNVPLYLRYLDIIQKQ
jgi:hypothetical protein